MTRPSWLDAIVGAELRDVHEVEVHFANEEPLTTGDLVLETDRGFFQILTAPDERRVRAMSSPADVRLVGDWSDRTGVVLKSKKAVDLSFRVARVDYVQRGDDVGGRRTIGAWLLGDASTVRVSILFEREDAEIGPPTLLWSYLAEAAREEPRLTFFGKK